MVEMPRRRPHSGYENRKEQISLLVSLKVRESVNISQEGKEEIFLGVACVPSAAADVI